jgi:hypothetical protein
MGLPVFFNVYIAVGVFVVVLFFDLNMQLLMSAEGRKEFTSMSTSTMWQHVLRAVALLVSILQISFAFKQMSELGVHAELQGFLCGVPIICVMIAIAYLFKQKRVMGGSLAAVYATAPAVMYLGFGPMSTSNSAMEKWLELFTLIIAMLSTTITTFAESKRLSVGFDDESSSSSEGEEGEDVDRKKEEKTNEKAKKAQGRKKVRRQRSQAAELGEAAKEVNKIFAKFGVSIDNANRAMGSASRRKYHVANFMFMVVLFGTELDMMSFLCGIPGFWGYNVGVLKALLILTFLSFVCPLGYFFKLKSDGGSNRARDMAPDDTSDLERCEPSKGNSTVDWLRNQNTTMSPFGGELTWYHIIPCVRFFMLLKPKVSHTDVDAIFRVNTLSSFTLGIYQFVGIVFTFAFNHELTLLVQLNMLAQFWNWTITVLYFTTPIATWMGRAAEVKTISCYYQGLMSIWAKLEAEGDVIALATEEANSEREKQKANREQIKKSVCQRIGRAFLGEGRNAENDVQVLIHGIKDIHVRILIQALRDQAIASIEMNKPM